MLERYNFAAKAYSFHQGVMDESRLHRAELPTWQNRMIQDLIRLGGL